MSDEVVRQVICVTTQIDQLPRETRQVVFVWGLRRDDQNYEISVEMTTTTEFDPAFRA